MAREDAAGFEAADVVRHRLGRDVEQRVAGKVAAFGRQVIDGIGNQLHGALQVGDAIRRSRAQLSLPAASPAGGPPG